MAQPLSLAVGDFNGDGIDDLAVADTALNEITILLGDGTGRLAGGVVAGGSSPYAVAVGDFDGDGIQDLAIANNPGYVTVLLGNGSGGFTQASNSPFATGSGSNVIVVGDFNGDGKADLAVGNGAASNVTILLGNGLGAASLNFTPSSGSPIGVVAAPTSITVGDFNGDGVPDLAVTTIQNVEMLIGDGTGRFTPASGTFTAGTNPSGTAAWDINGDGILDLAVTNSGSGTVSIFTGGKEPVTQNLTTTAPGTVTAGTTVPLTLTVAPATAAYNTPTGTVTFLDGSTTIGTAAQSQSPFTLSIATLSVGSHSLTANYSGDARTFASQSNTVTIVVQSGLLSQTITFGTISDRALGTGNVPLTATASSGLAVSYVSTTATVCGVSNGNIILAGVGSCSITASQAGNSSYSAAPNVIQAFNVTQGSQTITFNALNNVALSAGTVTLTATASSGLGVSYTSTTLAVCTVANSTVSLVSAGLCSITANQAGNANYTAATAVSQSFTVTNGTPQTITFDTILDHIQGESPFVIAAQSSSRLAVTLTSTTTTVCKVADNLVILHLAGTCSIQATQPGNGNVSAATPVTKSFNVAAALPGGSFHAASGSPYSANILAQSIVAADLNGDGFPDFLVADAFSNGKVTLLLTNSSGVINAGANLTVGSSPYAVAVGDFNGDGKLDFVTPNQGANTVSVMLANASGGYTASSFAVGNSPEAIAVGDFNGDGIQDLAVGNGGDNNVTVYLGDGQGGFTQVPGVGGVGASSPTGTQPRSIVVGDFNRDGIEDLAVANLSNNNVTVLLGTGTGFFTAATGSPFAVGTSPTTLVVGDFNADGKEDLAVANNTASGSISVLIGVGDGSFTAATGSPFGSGQFESVAVGDFNGDGIEDLVASNVASTANNVVVLLGDGTGAFTQQATTYPTGQSPASVITGDFNNDGIMDIATANMGGGNVTLLLGVASSTSPQTITFGPLSNVSLSAGTVTLSATASSQLAVSFASTTTAVCTVSGNTVTLVTAGTCTIVASQAGNSNYSAATNVPQSFTISGGGNSPPPSLLSQTINFAPIGSTTVGSGPIGLSATASSGLPVTFSSSSPGVCSVGGSSVTILTAGTCSITASQSGNATYSPATAFQSFTVAPVTQTITFGGLSNVPVGSSFSVGAVASSGLPVTFTSNTGGICTVSGNVVNAIAAGTCSITASQPGNSTTPAATPVTQKLYRMHCPDRHFNRKPANGNR